MNYGKKLKEIRLSKNLTQNNISSLLNISRITYSHYEVQEKIIPISRLNALSVYFDVSIDYIFELTEKENYENDIKEINKTLSGQRLKEFRKEKNLTLEKLGSILNTSYGTLAGYEIGRYIIATPFLYTICSKYKISADYLLGKIDNP
ncbi:MAG: helix-turn-helix domain-containing protein, partial [Ruminococcus sp.]|nr:helix-turn-helix domain-containing protein [Ruminococcus sp.]